MLVAVFHPKWLAHSPFICGNGYKQAWKAKAFNCFKQKEVLPPPVRVTNGLAV